MQMTLRHWHIATSQPVNSVRYVIFYYVVWHTWESIPNTKRHKKNKMHIADVLLTICIAFGKLTKAKVVPEKTKTSIKKKKDQHLMQFK